MPGNRTQKSLQSRLPGELSRTRPLRQRTHIQFREGMRVRKWSRRQPGLREQVKNSKNLFLCFSGRRQGSKPSFPRNFTELVHCFRNAHFGPIEYINPLSGWEAHYLYKQWSCCFSKRGHWLLSQPPLQLEHGCMSYISCIRQRHPTRLWIKTEGHG